MRFDLTDLQLFVNVCEAGTITGGADASHITLASASERIRGMEDSLGAPLLSRERRGVRLTPAGDTLLRHARLVLHQLVCMQGELREYGSGAKARVRMLCNTAAMSDHLPDLLAPYLAAQPGLSVDLEERQSDAIADAVRHGHCDIGVMSDAVSLANLQTFAFRPDPLVLVVPAHPLAERRAASLADVIDLAWVGLPEGSALQGHLALHARQLGRRPDYRLRVRSLEEVCRMVGQGVGVGIVPRAVAARYALSAGIRQVALAEAWANRQLVVCVRDIEALPVHAREIVGLLVDRVMQ